MLLQLTDAALETLKIHDGFHDEMIESVMNDLELEKDEALVKSLENISHYFKSKY